MSFLLGAAAMAVLVLVSIRSGTTATAQQPPATPAPAPAPGRGEEIWRRDCAYCHGLRGEGTFQGPAVNQSGTALIDFMVRTGRMPIPVGPTEGQDLLPPGPARDTPRRPPAYDEQQIQELVDYTAGFVTGPPAPQPPDLEEADLARGGELYRANCAACHQMAGSGGALAYGTVGTSLAASTPVEVIAAMRTGPGSMPVFPEAAIGPEETRDIVAYVQYLRDPRDRGGIPLWHIGPVGEGLVAWVVGIGAAVTLCRWLGEREPRTDH